MNNWFERKERNEKMFLLKEKGYSTKYIANKFKLAKTTVNNNIRLYRILNDIDIDIEKEEIVVGAEKECKICKNIFKVKSANHKFCSKECQQENYLKNSYERGRFLILERDDFTCIYCGTCSLDGKTKPSIELHADHVQSKSKGGRDIAGNLITACSICNLEKT